ncbi:hypothetical protein HZB60_08355 [candidate division KSB1 bacterium]|nr:hypothetical protein [candidate division KSB1 bacterium]
MKKDLLITTSALALVFVLAAAGWSWETTCSTSYGGGGWNSCSSSAVTASGGTSASAYVIGPSSTFNCSSRSAEAKHSGDNYVMKHVDCPSGTPMGTSSCCVRGSWTATNGQQYYVSATQTRTTNASCGPVTGRINNTNDTCNQEGPQGE